MTITEVLSAFSSYKVMSLFIRLGIFILERSKASLMPTVYLSAANPARYLGEYGTALVKSNFWILGMYGLRFLSDANTMMSSNES